MNPPLVKTTRTVPVSARDDEARPNADSRTSATPRNRIRYLLIGVLSTAEASIWARTSLIQGDHHLRDVGGHFKSAFGALQGNDNAFVVFELCTADAADQRAARADHAVRAGKVAELVDVVGWPDQLVDRCAGREAETQTLDRERVVAVAKSQSPPASAGSTDKSRLGDRDTNGAGDRVRWRCDANRQGECHHGDPVRSMLPHA